MYPRLVSAGHEALGCHLCSRRFLFPFSTLFCVSFELTEWVVRTKNSNYGCQTKPLFTQLSTELCTSSVQPTDSYIYTTFVDGEGPQALTRYGNPTNRVELVGAFGMEVRWQASDIADADKEKTGSGSSSTRVKVGIGVSVGMGVLLVIGVAALLLRTRREQKKQKLAAKSIQAGEAQDSEDKYLDDRETRAVDERPTELENLPSTLEMYVMPSEMRAVDERPVVVESSQLRHEMYVMPTEMGPGERYDRL